jgi:hypothetical protein
LGPRRALPRVLVLNGSEDLLEVLSEVLELAGFEVRTVRIPELEQGQVDIRALLREFNPRAVVFELSTGPDALELVLKLYALAELNRRVSHAVGLPLGQEDAPGGGPGASTH